MKRSKLLRSYGLRKVAKRKMKWIYDHFFILSNEAVFYGMVTVGIIMVVLTAIFVAKEIKENHANK